MELDRLVEVLVERVLARLEGRLPLPSVRPDPWAKPQPLVAANWKMSFPKEVATQTPAGVKEALAEYLSGVCESPLERVDTVVFPPATLIAPLAEAVSEAGVAVELGAQNMHPAESGAHTGEISAPLIRAAAGRWVIVGHSERRAASESEDEVAAKVKAGLDADLGVILCVGEKLDERERGAMFGVLRLQLRSALAPTALRPPLPAKLAIAYEPVWAIGTGKKASTDQIAEVAAFVRQVVSEVYDHARGERIRILYGGSVKPENALEVMEVGDIDGLLVGGASLAGDSFARIVEAADQAKRGRGRSPVTEVR